MGYTESIGPHANFPEVLGETRPKEVTAAACPPLTLRTVSNNPATVAFEPLQTQMFDVELIATGKYLTAQEEVIVASTAGGKIEWGGEAPPTLITRGVTFSLTENIPAGTYLAMERVDESKAAEILDLEREHKDDADYAYEQTIKHLANSVASLAGTPFTGADETAARRAALQALAGVVGERFVPAYPMVPGNWSILARTHCKTLAEQSTKRDRKEGGSHHASWTAQLRGKNLYLVPVVPTLRLSPSAVIKLDELPIATPDWNAEATPTCPFAPGQDLVVQTELKLPGGIIVPPGWVGSFVGDNSDALVSRFVFLLRAPGRDSGPSREFTVPPSQFGSLRAADPPAPTSAPVRYDDNPFLLNNHVKATQRIPTSDGEIPAGAIGEFYSDGSTATQVELWFDFSSVLDNRGGRMSNVIIDPANLQYLQYTDEDLPPMAVLPTAQPKPPDDTNILDPSANDQAQVRSESPPHDSNIDDAPGMDFTRYLNEPAGSESPPHDSNIDDAPGMDFTRYLNEPAPSAGESTQDEDQPVDNGGISAELSHFADEVAQGVSRRLQAAGKTVDELTAAAGKTVEELAAAIEEAIRKVRDKLSG